MVGVPLLMVVLMSLRTGFPGEGGPLTLANFIAVYSSPGTYKVLLNTLLFASGTVLVTIAFAVPLVWLLMRTDLPFKGTIYVLMTVGILIPVFLRTIAWILLLSPRIGLVNQWAHQLFGLDHPLVSLYNIPGMAFIQGVSFVPSAFFMLAAAYRTMDPSLRRSGLHFRSQQVSDFSQDQCPDHLAGHRRRDGLSLHVRDRGLRSPGDHRFSRRGFSF